MNTFFVRFTLMSLLFFNASFAQVNNQSTDNIQVVINPDAFLLGTFSEQLTRFYLIDKETQIDIYHPEEKSAGKYIAFFIKQNYKLEPSFNESTNGNYEIILPVLAQRLHATYYNDHGQFIKEKLDKDAKKHSYLLGIYYRYGKNLKDNIFEITINNSTKHSALLEVLKDVDVKKIVYNASESIPSTHTFYFEATPKLIKYFDYLKQEKAQLDFNYNSLVTVKEINNVNGETKKTKAKKNKELIRNLEYLFK